MLKNGSELLLQNQSKWNDFLISYFIKKGLDLYFFAQKRETIG